MAKCLSYGCVFEGGKNGFCPRHHKNANSTIVKDEKPIAKESDKRKVVNAELHKLVKILKRKYPFCQLKISPECTNQPDCGHHVHGRYKDNIVNEKAIKISCFACNNYVESHPTLAAKLGLKKSKFKTA